VKSVEVMTTPDKELGDCVAAAFRAATFRATKAGGSFSYPFIFDGKTPPADPPPLEPDSIDRVAISEAMAKVKPQLVACANASKAKGTVKVKVEVAPAGTVKSITIVETPEKSLGECVVAAVKGATFRATKAGGTFSYPFVFDGTKVEADEPETIDRAAIAEVVATLKPKVMACGDASKVRGNVKVKVEVAPAGSVTSVVVMATPDPKLGECVAELFRHAAFRRTAKGGTFSYPFIF
jgi:TonB family protein